VALNADILQQFQPILLDFPRAGTPKTVCTAQDAAQTLLHDWPHSDGEAFCCAVKACADLIVGRSAPGELHRAILRAAGEAGITAVSIVTRP